MKRLMTAIGCACLLTAVATAQSGSADTTDRNKMAKDKMSQPMMVTGCVAAGAEAEQYMLIYGMMAGDTTGKSYDLQGGDLKAHVGHKVEVTGTMDDGPMTAKDKMEKGKMDKDDKDDKVGKDKTSLVEMHAILHVKSVKMLTSTCP